MNLSAMITVVALAFTVCGCAGLYLASPHQKWLAQRLPAKPFAAGGGLLLAAGLTAWIAALRPLSGLFAMLSVAMVCLFAFPCAGVLRGARRGSRHEG